MNITENILEIKNLSKQFPGVKALVLCLEKSKEMG